MADTQRETRIFYPSAADAEYWWHNGQFVRLEQRGRRYFAVRFDESRVETTCYTPDRIDRELAAGQIVETKKLRGVMTTFRKKPVVIEAVQWFKNGDHPDDGREVFPECNTPGLPSTFSPGYTGEYAGQLLEGKVVRYFRRPDVSGERPCEHCGVTMHQHGWIDTLEGGHVVCPGDWIITGVKGERYPCKPDVFEKSYEPVE